MCHSYANLADCRAPLRLKAGACPELPFWVCRGFDFSLWLLCSFDETCLSYFERAYWSPRHSSDRLGLLPNLEEVVHHLSIQNPSSKLGGSLLRWLACPSSRIWAHIWSRAFRISWTHKFWVRTSMVPWALIQGTTSRICAGNWYQSMPHQCPPAFIWVCRRLGISGSIPWLSTWRAPHWLRWAIHYASRIRRADNSWRPKAYTSPSSWRVLLVLLWTLHESVRKGP